MVKRILQLGLVALVWLLLAAGPVFAVSVTDALYVADIVVQNSGEEEATGVSAVCTINTQALLDGKYVTEDMLNTAIQTSGGTDIPYMPGVGSNPWVFFVSSIGANEQKSYLFYSGGPAMQTGLYYFPGGGGMTAEDCTQLELDDNFEIEQKGYIDTSIDLLRPNAAGAETNLWWYDGDLHTTPDPNSNYTMVDEETSDEWNSSVLQFNATYARDLYNLPDSSIPDGAGINYIEVYFRCQRNEASAAYAMPSIRSGSTTDDGTEISLTDSWTTYSERWYYNPDDDETWEKTDIDSLQIGVRLKGSGSGSSAICTQVYIKVVCKNLVDKKGAIRLYVSDEESITAAIYEYQAGSGTWESPTSASGTGWSNVGNTYDDNTTTYATYDIPTKSYSAYLYLDTDVYSDRVRYYISRETTDVNSMNLDVYYDGGWHSIYSGAPTVDSWAEVAIGSVKHVTQARMKFWNDAIGASRYVYVHEFDFREPISTEAVSVTATDISSSVHTIKATADGTNLKIYVDDVEEDSAALSGESVIDNANDWKLAAGGSILYMEYSKITVSSSLEQHIVYEHSTTFSDQEADSGTADSGSTTTLVDDALTQGDDYWNNMTLEIVTTTDGEAPQGETAIVTDFTASSDTLHFDALTASVENGDTYELRNDATPTFRTSSSDSDVSATFQNFRPIDEAICTTSDTEETPEMLTEPPEQPTELYSEGEVNHLPGAQFINDLLDEGGIPHDLFWIPLCFGMAAGAVVLSYFFLRSMLFVSIIGAIIILFFALTGAIPLWTFFIYAVLAAGILVSERVFGW